MNAEEVSQHATEEPAHVAFWRRLNSPDADPYEGFNEGSETVRLAHFYGCGPLAPLNRGEQ